MRHNQNVSSNYLSSSQVSPSQEQTKIEEISRLRKIMVFCLVLGDNTETAFPVKLPSDTINVGEFRDLIAEKNKVCFDKIDAKDLILWQVNISDADVKRMEILNTKPPSEINIEQELGGKTMYSKKDIKFYFPQDPVDENIHVIIMKPTATTDLKRPISEQNMRARKLVRTDGPVDISKNFYVPFSELDSTRSLEDVIDQNLCALLVGHFQSGKTSVLRYLCNTKTNHFYVHSSTLTSGFLSGLCDKLSLNPCTSCDMLCKEIERKFHNEEIVILIDEFDRFLFNSRKNKKAEHAIDEIRELTKLISDRSIGIKSIVYTGTYSIVDMLKDGVPQIRKVIESASQESNDSLSGGDSLFGEESERESLSHASKCLLEPQPIPSPFRAKIIQASDFTRDQHMSFFKDIQENRRIIINEEVLNDIYSVTNGYAGLEGLLASLCMEYSANEKSLEFDKWNERFTEFRRKPTNHQITSVNHIEKHLSDCDDELIENAKNLLGCFLQRGTLRSSEIRENDISAIMHLQAIGIIKNLGGDLFGFTSNIIFDLLSTKYYPLYREGLGTISDINEPQKFLKDVLRLLKFIHYDVIFHSLASNLRSFSETIVQGELYALLHSAVSNPTFRLFRETRTLKGSEKKCNLWLCNDSKEYGIECKVNNVSNDEISNATRQALEYTNGRKNACSMFLLNFVPSDSISENHNFYFPYALREGLYFEAVYILYSKANRNAQIFRCNEESVEIPFATER